MLPVDEVSMASDPDDYASLGEKFRRWIERQAERQRKRKWLFAIASGVLWLMFLYWLIHHIARRFL
jgi:hypothetical protein